MNHAQDTSQTNTEPPRLKPRFRAKLKAALAYIPWAETLLAAYFCATDRKTPAGAKAILFGAIGYFILPLDLIPDLLGALGYTDDLAVLLAAVKAVQSNITPAHEARARRALAQTKAEARAEPAAEA